MALDDATYKALIQSSDSFKNAEADLSTTWTKTKSGLAQKELKSLTAEQRVWLQTTRDILAADAIAQGASPAEAYARVTRERISRLEIYRQQNELDSRTAYEGILAHCAHETPGLCLIPAGELAEIRLASTTDFNSDKPFFDSLGELAAKQTRVRVTGKLASPSRFDPAAHYKVSVIRPATATPAATAPRGQAMQPTGTPLPPKSSPQPAEAQQPQTHSPQHSAIPQQAIPSQPYTSPQRPPYNPTPAPGNYQGNQAVVPPPPPPPPPPAMKDPSLIAPDKSNY